MRILNLIVLGIVTTSLGLGAIGCTADSSTDTPSSSTKEPRPMSPDQRTGTPQETGAQNTSGTAK